MTCSLCRGAGHTKAKCGLAYDHALRRAVRGHLLALDAEMRQPSTEARGKRIAALCNALEMALDQAEHFGVWMPPTGVPPRRRESAPEAKATA